MVTSKWNMILEIINRGICPQFFLLSLTRIPKIAPFLVAPCYNKKDSHPSFLRVKYDPDVIEKPRP
jgi:hypothetical protein